MATEDLVVISTLSDTVSAMDMTSCDKADRIRVAVTQAEPVWLDLPRCVEKTCKLIEEAAQNGAKLITFPECWLVGYPAWIWSRPIDLDLHVRYIKNSMHRDSPEMDRIRACARRCNIVVGLSFSENEHDSLYISQSIIGGEGEERMHRRKMKPTHMERTIFGDASGECLNNVVDTQAGRIGALACWEHTQPLLKYHTILQREQIHIAAWPPLWKHTGGDDMWSMSREGCRNLSRAYAIESQSFVLHTTAVLSQAGIDIMATSKGAMFTECGGGSSAIFGPDGRQLSDDLPETKEGILYADLDMSAILRAKALLDPCGHYSRPDLLYLGVDGQEKKHLRSTTL